MSCARKRPPESAFAEASEAFVHGDLEKAQRLSQRSSEQYRKSDAKWVWKFRVLEARAALWRGLFEDARKLVQSEPVPSSLPDLVIQSLTIAGVADVHTRDFSGADRLLDQAFALCQSQHEPSCGEVFQAQGLLASERGDSVSAERLYETALSFARSNNDSFLESTALLNLGMESLAQERFDEALDRSQAAYDAAQTIDARFVQLTSRSNMGWAYYKLGDVENALQVFLEAEKAARQLQFIYDQENDLTNLGHVYLDEGKFDLAEKSFQQALALAEGISAKQDIYNVERMLARLALLTGDVSKAREYAQKALDLARESGSHPDEMYPLLMQGQIDVRAGDADKAERTFQRLEADKSCPVSLKWEAQHSLARLYEDSQALDKTDRQYRAAIATFEGARADVRHQDFHLSFLSNGWHIYDDYIHFLISRGKTSDALRWADYSRARTLAEGLGLLTNATVAAPPPLNAQEIAHREKAVILFFWLGEKQSYLWAIAPQKTSVFPLPPASEVDAAVQRYRQSIAGPQDVLDSANSDGRALYSMLVAPAQALLPKDARVFIIPDGSLNNLNFETLLVPEPKLHYWIEDATVANASSLRILAAANPARKNQERSLLLLGDSVPPNDKYPALPKAAAQMDSVARHFPASQERVIRGQQATPAAYLASNPDAYSHIHFVAHGIASRLSPLDSSIVLSKQGEQEESFKLYARDIIRHPLTADLVTISACYSTGERSYSGEGLVGLSWAFLRAGAHNVIAALWDVSDSPAQQLMDTFYGELDKGASPDVALRAAKLSLLHGTLHNPFYWAPFQLYRGGRSATRSAPQS